MWSQKKKKKKVARASRRVPQKLVVNPEGGAGILQAEGESQNSPGSGNTGSK